MTTPTTLTPAAAKPEITPHDVIYSCVKQLGRSERGAQALTDLRELLRNGGTGLDSDNTEVLIMLLQYATRAGHAGTVLDALHPYRKRT